MMQELLLVLINYAMRFSEAVALKTSQQATNTLLSYIIRDLIDFTSVQIQYTIYVLDKLFCIKNFKMIMICKLVDGDARNWVKRLKPLLFAVWEVPQAFTSKIKSSIDITWQLGKSWNQGSSLRGMLGCQQKKAVRLSVILSLKKKKLQGSYKESLLGLDFCFFFV